jgi:pyruvate dehydrogenase E2 component (dihydrolipoamide acetyltransferase)
MSHQTFLLPDLGEGLDEAEIVTWRVAEGDRVELNQPLVEVNTAKALVEIPSPFEGVVVTLHGTEGDIIDVGKPLVTIDVAGMTEEAAHGAREAGEGPPKRRPVLVGYGVAEDEPEITAQHPPEAPAREGPAPATPPVRRLAKDLGVDLSSVSGTGPNGRVTREDVERAASAPAARPGGRPAGHVEAVERIPVRGTRRLIAQKMARSAREIPHVTTFLTVDAHWLEAFRQELAAERGDRMSALPIVVRALAEITLRHPKLNASFDEEAAEIVLYRDCHIGIAVDTDRGLLVPVVRDVKKRGVVDIGEEIGTLARAAREGSLTPDQMSGGTITVTNVGSFGAESGTPIINQPESAILATGVIEPRALVVEGEVMARPAMTLSLSFDHRLLDGAEAGRALRDLGDVLESPFHLGSLPR